MKNENRAEPVTTDSAVRCLTSNVRQKYMKPSLYLYITISAFTLGGCTSYQDGVRNTASSLGAIQIRDIHQADYLREWFAQEPKIKGRYSVTPGSRIVTVTFKDDLPEGKSEIFRTRMIELKEQMRKEFGYEINTLIFIFPSQEFRA